MDTIGSAFGLLLKVGDGVASTKEAFENWSIVSSDALHVLVGVGIQLAIAAFMRKGVASFMPWVIVLTLEIVNELNDIYLQHWGRERYAIAENSVDIVLTMLLPTILLVLARTRPQIFTPRA